MNFVVGQRWVSHGEAQLGLGVIVEIAGRRVIISFPAVEEERIYASGNAPLSRVIYQAGDHIITRDDRALSLVAARELKGIVFYTGIDDDGNEHTLSELELNCFVHLTTPRQRLLSGQLDKNIAYQLRIATLDHRDRWQRSAVRGLLGCRTSLLAHQLSIAAEVAQRHAPRVLLADEVGLGKTIEAGMIIHHQLQTGRAHRVLIVVPPTLLHQWLIEMLRRFNLRFAIFDRERLQALQDDTDDNPFETEQLVLCSLDFLSEDPQGLQLASSAHWDLQVVDEAHHLHWSEHETNAGYRCIETLSRHAEGLLLLTATPEQAGTASHFARLRLLDPSRFYDLDAFRKEEAGYQQLNTLVQHLLQQEGSVDGATLGELRGYLGEDFGSDNSTPPTRDNIIAQLLDRHGTGRVMFRNTRAAIPCFPTRKLHSYPLPCPELYQHSALQYSGAALYPELNFDRARWVAEDPRVGWLQQLLKRLRPEKVLVICANADTATALEYHLHMRLGIRSTAFHQGLSIIERDRAAAWFAETDNGAQALVCSEIGSEGRNFQFSHHLVLFDLPLNPDLLEQRIGRLDRIGQQHDIDIHVPYLQNTAMEVLFHWYHEGMNLFQQSFSAGYSVYEHFERQLQQQLEAPDENLARLIEQTREFTNTTKKALQEGRDPLLELNSCNTQRAGELIAAIEATEDNAILDGYMEQVFDLFGIEHDFHSEHTLVLRPGDHLLTDQFPGLDTGGTTVTYDREKALIREDIEFLSWEHPMVTDTMDLILEGELGNATACSISVKGLAPGNLMLEAIFSVVCMAPASLQLDRYLSLSPLRIFLDAQGRDLEKVLSHQQLNTLCDGIKHATAQVIVKQVRSELEHMLELAEKMAERELPRIVAEATAAMQHALGAEAERLIALQAVNPSIRDGEIRFFQQQIAQGKSHIEKASLLMQGLRVVVST